MPCSDGGPDREYYSQAVLDRLDQVTRLLCWVMNALSEDTVINLCTRNPELRTWWRNHQEEDMKRTQAEIRARIKKETRAKVMEKLTAEEIQILGLK